MISQSKTLACLRCSADQVPDSCPAAAVPSTEDKQRRHSKGAACADLGRTQWQHALQPDLAPKHAQTGWLPSMHSRLSFFLVSDQVRRMLCNRGWQAGMTTLTVRHDGQHKGAAWSYLAHAELRLLILLTKAWKQGGRQMLQDDDAACTCLGQAEEQLALPTLGTLTAKAH